MKPSSPSTSVDLQTSATRPAWMAFVKQQLYDLSRPDSLRAIGGILFGCLIAAIGLTYFINPYGLVPGGIFGICIVLHALFPILQVGTYALLIQIPLLLISSLVLGGRLGFRTLIAAISLPLMVNLLSSWSYPTAEALRRLDPGLILGGHLDMTHDLIVSALIGGALIGVGTGLIIRQQASSGGSDVIAMLVHKFTHIRFANSMMMVDGSIVLAGLMVIGMGFGLPESSNAAPRSWMLSFYSLITMYLLNRSIAIVLSGAKDCMLVHIICTKEESTILRNWILTTLDRTATRTDARGLYSEAGKEILLMVVRNKELPTITDGIKQMAPDCFVVVTDAYDAYGYRWKELPTADALNL
ncbi:MAG: YitT family protein [Alloprevotella sp.]